MSDWPKGPTAWIDGRRLFVSVPFTFNLYDVRPIVSQLSFLWDAVTVGGPAVRLMPDFEWPDIVTVDRGDMPGVLERVNPLATRTSLGCPNACEYCGVSRIEPEFVELVRWEPKPIICDNNFLACSESHRDRVYNSLDGVGTVDMPVDFNQGLDARLLTQWDADWLRKLKAKCRLAYDSPSNGDAVRSAFAMLRAAKIPLKMIFVYALIGWKDTPSEAWARCMEIEKMGVYCCPMWFHELDAMQWNEITKKQEDLGWADADRTKIMGYFWKHRGIPMETEL
jgi:hypothetical protein